MSYHPSTNDDTISYSLNKNNDACRNQRNSTKDIQPNFIKYNQNNNNTGITSPSLKNSRSQTPPKKENNTKNPYLHQHQTKYPTKNIQSSKITSDPIYQKKDQIRNIQNQKLIPTKSKNNHL